MAQRGWEEETGRLSAEIKRLQGQIEQEVAMQVEAGSTSLVPDNGSFPSSSGEPANPPVQVSRSRLEFDQKLFENNRKHTTLCERYQVWFGTMKLQVWFGMV